MDGCVWESVEASSNSEDPQGGGGGWVGRPGRQILGNALRPRDPPPPGGLKKPARVVRQRHGRPAASKEQQMNSAVVERAFCPKVMPRVYQGQAKRHMQRLLLDADLGGPASAV